MLKEARKITLTLILMLACALAGAQEDRYAPMFPFQPTHDAPSNITNVRTWTKDKESEAGASGFIMSSGDRFIDGEGNVRRFLGTNICFTGCFPEKEEADKVAEELARYGINIVRLHYAHHQFPKDKIYPEPDSFIEPEQLDRFDYLLYKLKQQGIYTYFQLNIARKFGAQNGFENASGLPWYNNGIDNYEFRMLNLQKKFHQQILSHVNPYTGTAYKDEPAIAMLELSNENSIVYAWFTPRYNFPSLCEPYGSELKFMWNRFLSDKYADTKTLKEEWGKSLKGDGSEVLPDGIFKENYFGRNWSFQADKTGIATWKPAEATSKDKLKGSFYASVRVDEIGKNPKMLQFYRGGMKCEAMMPYTIHFKARSDKNAAMTVRLAMAHAPWTGAGLQEKVELSKNWKEYTFGFVTSIDDDNIRLSFTDFTPGIFDIADISITRGIEFRFPEDQALEDASIALPGVKEWSSIGQRAIDFTEFIAGLEESYFRQMRANVTGNIKARQMVTGTQLQYGLDLPQAKMDYCDFHSYWCHPSFPGKNWDQSYIQVKNASLANGDGTPGSNLMTISRGRILGRPFTVSEYDHPNLNQYAAEGNLMCAATGAFQGWNAIIQFAWSHNRDFFRNVLSPQFDMCSASAKLVHLPACYAMFVRGDVSSSDGSVVFARKKNSEDEIRMIAKERGTYASAKEKDHLLSYLPLAVKTGKEIEEIPSLFKDNGQKIIRTVSDVPEEIAEQYKNKEVKSTTGEITWNWQQKGAGYFMVDTPNTKVFSGFVRGRSFDFSGIVLTPGETRMDWLTFSLTQASHGHYLMAASGKCENTGEKIVELKNGNISCGSANGGAEGTGPVLCEGIAAEIKFKGMRGKITCYSLDCAGERKDKVKVTETDNDAIVHIGPQYNTLWYELIIE